MASFLNNYFKFIKNFIPSRTDETSVGLDVGSSEIKLVEIKKSGNAYELVNYAIEPVEGEDILSAIRKSLEKLSTPCKYLYTSVYGKGTLIRYIDIPRMSLDDLRNSFNIEADKYFPFAQDEIYTDCYILDEKGKSSNMPVMAAAAKKELVDQRIKMFNDLEIKVDFIGINPIALANVINVTNSNGSAQDAEKDQSSVALLDFGENVSSLSIIVNKVPRFTRDVFIGDLDIIKKISNSLGVSIDEAKKLKEIPGERKAEVSGIVESEVENIVQELRLSFDYFTTENNMEITKLCITGDGSTTAGICELFSSNLDINAEQWNPVKSLQISEKIDQAQLGSQSVKLGVALGLALYHYD